MSKGRRRRRGLGFWRWLLWRQLFPGKPQRLRWPPRRNHFHFHISGSVNDWTVWTFLDRELNDEGKRR